MSSPPADPYADHQTPHSEDKQIESAVARSGPDKQGACDACGRDVEEGERLCETCSWVAREYGEDLLWADGNGASDDEDPWELAFEEMEPAEHAFESAFDDLEPRENGDPFEGLIEPEIDGYRDRGIWEEEDQTDLFPDIGNDWKREWRGMPEYQHEFETAFASVEVRFEEVETDAPALNAGPIEDEELEEDGESAYGREPDAVKVNFACAEDRDEFFDEMEPLIEETAEGGDSLLVGDREEFARAVDQNIRDTTQSIWYPEAEIRKMSNKEYRVPAVRAGERHRPKYPVYVPSKGRAEVAMTPDYLEEMGVPHQIVVEPDEVDEYADRFGSDRLIVLPEDLEPGLHTTRTWIKRYCQSTTDAARHWQMDDNIQGFHRYNDNLKTPVGDGAVIRCMEDFVDRYENVALAGPRYFMFVTRKSPMPPVTLNTRVYSCTLVNNAIPHEWELRYNDDTDISLRALKDGWTTVIFNAFLQWKTPTMELSGGLTEDYEAMDDRREFAEMLKDAHPDVVEVTEKFGRVHHHVDYGPFKGNELEPKDRSAIEAMPRVDNRDMVLYVDGEPVTQNPARTGAIR